MNKKLLFSILCMISLSFPVYRSYAADTELPLSIGDYITLGRYYDEPILWRCIDIDGNGMLMMSDKILCFKVFDVPGNHGGSHDRIRSYGRYDHGSNYWGDSNIRSWLNSEAAAGEVEWLCGNPPSEDAFRSDNGKENAYADEKGFLADGNFTVGERNAIKEVCQRNLLDPLDEEIADGGTAEAWEEWKESGPFFGTYKDICFEYVRDKIFLLDVFQLWDLEQKDDILGVDYYIADVTDIVAENYTEPDYLYLYDDYLLRTPYGRMRIVGPTGDMYYGDSVFTNRFGTSIAISHINNGIRPAFYLNENTMVIRSGSGSESDPYVIDGKASYINVGDVVGNIYSTDIVTYVDDIPITAYNIGGKTIIPIEDLRDYGFDVNWNEEDKVLEASVSEAPVYGSGGNGSSGVTGSVAGNIYHTDITLFVNGIPLGSYNIGGVTCAAVEDLGADSDTDEVLSKYGMRYTYNDSDRTLRLYIKR